MDRRMDGWMDGWPKANISISINIGVCAFDLDIIIPHFGILTPHSYRACIHGNFIFRPPLIQISI